MVDTLGGSAISMDPEGAKVCATHHGHSVPAVTTRCLEGAATRSLPRPCIYPGPMILLRRQQADLFHERSCIPIVRLAADFAGLQFEDGRATHRRKAPASGRYPREVAFVRA